jgi:hypothetical protein
LKLIANEDKTIQITQKSAGGPGIANYTEIKSDKVTLNKKKALLTQITWTMLGCTYSGYNFVSGAGNMQKTGDECFTKTKYFMREGDKGMCSGSFTLISPPYTPYVCSCEHEIKKAGQQKVKCN